VENGCLKPPLSGCPGSLTSRLQHDVIDQYLPAVNKTAENMISVFNSSHLRYLTLIGNYEADSMLLLPSMTVLNLQGTVSDSAQPSSWKANAHNCLLSFSSVAHPW
jgi:hypothetical protein